MISGISNGGIYYLQPQAITSVTGSSSDTDEQNEDSASSKNGAIASVSSQTSELASRVQGTIVSSLLNQSDEGKLAGGPPAGGPPPGGPPPSGAGPTEETSDSYLVDLLSVEEDDEDETSVTSLIDALYAETELGEDELAL
ncbi:MAG: hypothetical protein JKY82_04615 [Rhizobiaceae bacterium]|nr:hypothetical protein [Rhizobiaceae bacterium]